MKAYTAFFKKELLEMSRTYKLLIMGAVFFLLGAMNPLSAKYLPMLVSSMMPEGINITITEPTALDSWMQFFKNVPQIGLIVSVIVFSGMMTNELSKGTLINILTKGLARRTVILAKFTSAVVLWSVSYILCFTISYGYTWFFWKTQVPNLLFSIFCLWFFGIMLISIVTLGSILSHNSYGALLLTGSVVVLLFLLNLLPKLEKYNPLMLTSSNMALLSNTKDISNFIIPLCVALGITIIALIGSILIFNKKRL